METCLVKLEIVYLVLQLILQTNMLCFKERFSIPSLKLVPQCSPICSLQLACVVWCSQLVLQAGRLVVWKFAWRAQTNCGSTVCTLRLPAQDAPVAWSHHKTRGRQDRTGQGGTHMLAVPGFFPTLSFKKSISDCKTLLFL